MAQKRIPNWGDFKKIVELKTFYLLAVLILVGIICLLLGSFVIADLVVRSVISALGVTLVTSSTVSLVIELYLRFDIVEFMSAKLLSEMPEHITGNTGITEFNRDRKGIDFRDFWKKADGNVKIIGISSNDVLAAANLPWMRERIDADENFTVKILLLCPWSITGELRASASVYDTHNQSIAQTYAVIVDIMNFRDSLRENRIDPSRVQIGLYDDIPSLSMVFDDSKVIVTPLLVVTQGGSSPYFIANSNGRPGDLYGLYSTHFDTVWASATKVEDSTIEDAYRTQRIQDNHRLSLIPEKHADWVLMATQVMSRSTH